MFSLLWASSPTATFFIISLKIINNCDSFNNIEYTLSHCLLLVFNDSKNNHFNWFTFMRYHWRWICVATEFICLYNSIDYNRITPRYSPTTTNCKRKAEFSFWWWTEMCIVRTIALLGLCYKHTQASFTLFMLSPNFKFLINRKITHSLSKTQLSFYETELS